MTQRNRERERDRPGEESGKKKEKYM